MVAWIPLKSLKGFSCNCSKRANLENKRKKPIKILIKLFSKFAKTLFETILIRDIKSDIRARFIIYCIVADIVFSNKASDKQLLTL